jgi:hypothetical protein
MQYLYSASFYLVQSKDGRMHIDECARQNQPRMPQHVAKIDEDEAEAPYICAYDRYLVITSTDTSILRLKIMVAQDEIINANNANGLVQRVKLIDFWSPPGVVVTVCSNVPELNCLIIL